MPQCTQAYSFKLPVDTPFRTSLGQFQDLIQRACRTLLAKFWTESWLDTLAGCSLKAYKVIGEEQVTLTIDGQSVYLLSRIRRILSRKLSNWIRGSLYEVLTYKAALVGIKVTRVNPRGTSSYCPRCGAKGLKITEPTTKTADPKGRFFYCPHCQYAADRDYIAAINIFRMYQQQRKKTFNLINAKPVSYIGAETPPNCSWRGIYSTSVG